MKENNKRTLLEIFNRVIFASVILLIYSAAYGQDRSPARGVQAGNSYSISDIENVNLTNGNLMLNIPLASLPGRGTVSGVAVSMRYDSKLWDNRQELKTDGIPGDGYTASYSIDHLRKGDQGGWRVDTGGYSLKLKNRTFLMDAEVPCQTMNVGAGQNEYGKNGYVNKLEMLFPDGNIREFRPFGNGAAYQDYYNTGYFSIDPNGFRRTYTYSEAPNNIFNCFQTDTQVTTSGMTYYSSDGSGIRLFVPYNSTGFSGDINKWKLYYPNGTLIENLPADDTSLNQRMTDRNGNTVKWKGATVNGHAGSEIINDVGQFVFFWGDTNGDTKIDQPGIGGELLETTIHYKTVWVYRKYQMTTAPNAANGPSLQTEKIAQAFSVIDTITLPSQAGGLTYVFTYNGTDTDTSGDQTGSNYTNGFGELKSITLPSTAKATYSYTLDSSTMVPLSCSALLSSGCYSTNGHVIDNSVTKRDLVYNTQYDGSTSPVTETTLYNVFVGVGGTVTSPNGGAMSTSGTEKNGYTSTTHPDGSTEEKIWAANDAPGLNGSTAQKTNAYVKTEFTSITNASGALTLTAIKDYDYDKNGNILEAREYDWVAYSSVDRSSGKPVIPNGAPLKRKTVNTYYNPTPIATDTTTDSPNHYANPLSPRLHNLIQSSEIRDVNGTPVSRSEFYYDGGIFSPNIGNLTETRVWDSTKSGYSNPLTTANSISTTALYDQYGNPTLATDAKNNQTQITYGSISGPSGNVTGLYPTQTIAAYGTAIARTSAAAYDFYTGRVTTATDVDNNVSALTEYDPLGRPTKVRTANGTPLESWTTTEYDAINRRLTVRSDLETKGDGRKVATQFYDQLGRVRLSKTLENAATQSATDEIAGIKVQTRYMTTAGYTYSLSSNPFRAAYSTSETDPTMGWTRSKAINTGRHAETETFSGSGLPAPWGSNASSTGIVQTDIDTNATTVTDQAGKLRRSITNGIGQLIRVDEPNSSNQLGAVTAPNQDTNYTYDTLNNLTTVTQGVQTRTFAYNSLSRLLSAANPESGTVNYLYDNNGNLTQKTDARSIQTNYLYDALNRVTQRSYTDSTPIVNYTYDNLTNAKGRLTKVASTVSTTEYTAFDILGRVTGHKQTTDGTAYTTGYTYNLSGALDEETYPSGCVVKNILNQNGDLAIVESKKNAGVGYFNYAKNFTYTAAGAVSSMQLGNGRWETALYNNRLQVTQITLGTTPNATDKLKLNFDYGSTTNNGNVQSQTITVPGMTYPLVQTYNYDSLNRIQDATETSNGSQTWSQAFGYDRYGNRNITSGTGVTGFSFNGNRITAHSYDAAGNTTNDGSKTFTYDAENKQTSVNNGSTGQYWYDGDGKRIKKYVPGTGETTIFVYDAAAKLVADYSTNVIPAQDAKVAYTTTDTLGSPRINTDQNGNVISRHDYHPFGEEISTSQRTTGLNYSGDSVRKQFTGHDKDSETDLDFVEARMYANRLGRFTAVDSVGPDLKNPQTLNKYQYCLNNPLRMVDKNGKYEEDVHRDLTNLLAYAAGFTANQAAAIADADQKTDEGFRNPWRSQRAREEDHFTTETQRDEQWNDFGSEVNRGGRDTQAFMKLGRYLHNEQDSFSHAGYGPGIGHILGWYDVDKTDMRPGLAEDMARRTFDKLVDARNLMAKNDKRSELYRPISFGAVKGLISRWVREADPQKKKELGEEIKRKIQNGRDIQRDNSTPRKTVVMKIN